MKKLKLLLAFCALLLGWSNASAYTVSDLTSAGWTQVTAASITGVSDNYYVLVDANSSAYVMSADATHYRPCYKTINNPVENPSFVWILEGSDNTFNLKSASTGAYFKQASGWNTSVGDGRNGSTASLQFTLSEGKYSIQCVGQGLVGHWNDDGAAVKEDGENIAANKAAANAPGFYLYSISKAAYNAALVAARAAGVSSATKASPVDVTSYIQNADWSGDWGAWEFTCTSSGNIQWGQKTLESWNANNVIIKQELSGVPNGLYKLTADVISGPGAKHAAYVYAIGDSKVNGGTVSQDASASNYTTMSNEVSGKTLTADNVSVTGNSLTVGIDQSTGWIVADNFKLYYYGPTIGGEAIELPANGAMAADTWYYIDVAIAADDYNATATTLGDIVYTTDGSILIEDQATVTTNFTATDNSLSATRYYVKSSTANTLAIEVTAPSAAEKKDLADAIDAAEGKTLGFENGEYAPYNNVDALTKLAAAKAIIPETAGKAAVVAATTALTGATWTANDGSVECVYNGNFAEGQGSPAANIQQYGWTRTNGWGQFKNDGFESSTAYYNQPGSLQYGNAGVYTMPLKAQTIYRLQFKYAKWDGNFAPTVSVLNEGSGMAAQTFENASSNYKDGYNSVDMVFVTAAAGNYVLSLSASSNYVITGVSITKAASQVLEFADGSVPTYALGTYPTVKITRTLTADKWASAIYPFAVSGNADLTVATLSSFKDSQLDFSTANPSTANKPFLMKSDAGLNEISLSNVEVAAAAASYVKEGGVTFTGVYSSTPIDDSAINYVLSNNKLYKVGTLGATMNPYRAYFTVAGASSVKPLSFVIDGTATGVDSVEAAEAEEDGALYNTAGQQVTEDYKGIVIKNGKKYLNK